MSLLPTLLRDRLLSYREQLWGTDAVQPGENEAQGRPYRSLQLPNRRL